MDQLLVEKVKRQEEEEGEDFTSEEDTVNRNPDENVIGTDVFIHFRQLLTSSIRTYNGTSIYLLRKLKLYRVCCVPTGVSDEDKL